MDAFDQVVDSLKAAGALLESEELEPDPSRDWVQLSGKVSELHACLARMSTHLDAGRAGLDEQDTQRLSSAVARTLSSAAAVSFASGNRAKALELWSRAEQVEPSVARRAELRAAAEHPDWFARFEHAHWLARHGKPKKAAAALQKLRKSAAHPALKTAIQDAPEVLEPVERAPTMFTLNGFGTSMYGARDRRADGTVVSTLCLAALFIPVFPLTAYRVFREGNQYQFYGKVPLSGFATWYRRALAVAVTLAIVASGVNDHLNSPERLSGLALKDAQQVEKSGTPAQALEAYEALLHTYAMTGDPEALTSAGDAWVRLRAAKLPSPLTPLDVELVRRFAGAATQLPPPARFRAEAFLAKQTQPWLTQLGTASAPQLDASIRLLQLVQPASAASSRPDLRAREVSLRKQRAAALVAEWPYAALSEYVELMEDPEAAALADALVERLAKDDALLLDADFDVKRWMLAAKDRKPEQVKVLGERLERLEADAAVPERQALLESQNRASLLKALSRSKRDPLVSAELATLDRMEGRPQVALSRLLGLGAPGEQVGAVQAALAAVYADQNRGEQAGQVLERYVAQRQPRFVAAREALMARSKEREAELYRQARDGLWPKETQAKIEAAKDDEAKQAVYEAWLDEELRKDAQLGRLRARHAREAAVIPAALLQGRLQLERAATASGAAREDLLRQTEATFLSVQVGAEGSPDFHIGLGEVYHRLGKAEEGEAQLAKVLALQSPQWSHRVGLTYRELGLISRAREVLQREFDTREPRWKDEAAHVLALMASTLGDRQNWLERISGRSPEVQVALSEVKARRASQQGLLPEADGEFAKLVTHYERDAARNDSAANNAALALLGRFSCTGERAHLDRAVKHFESALRTGTESSVLLNNAADALAQRLLVDLLGHWFEFKALLPSQHEQQTLLATMLEGPLRQELLSRLRAHGDTRRLMELARRAELLSPTSTEPYKTQLHWLRMLEDEEGLNALMARVRRIKAFDHTLEREGMERFRSGALDPEIRTAANARLEALAKVKGSPATRAAALMLAAASRDRLFWVNDELELLRKLAEARQQARQLFPEMSSGNGSPQAALSLGLREVIAANPELQVRWEAKRRTLGLPHFVFEQVQERPELRAASAASAQVKEARRLYSEKTDDALSETSWLVGWLTDDAALMSRSRAQLQKSPIRIADDLDVLLSAHEKYTGLQRKLLAQARGE